MAGGGIKINNIKVSGGADGKTPIFKIENGKLYNSYANGKDGSWVELGQVKGNDGVDGKDGLAGAKLLSQELIGQDEQGGNIYKQTFSDGTEAYFTAPKGQDANPAEKGTTVTVGGVAQDTWSADSKVDKYTEASKVNRYYGVDGNGNQYVGYVMKEPTWQMNAGYLATYFSKTEAGDKIGGSGENGRVVLITDTPAKPYQAANKKYVDDWLSGKLDKVNDAYQIYGTDENGYQKAYRLTSSANGGHQIPIYDDTYGEAVLRTNTPQGDLDCANKKYVDDGLDGKVDKVTTAYKVYGTDGSGNQKAYYTGWSASASLFQLMDQTPNGGYEDNGDFTPYINGTYMVGIPYKPSHATPKKWVEDTVKLYKHLITISIGAVYYITALNHSATAIENLSDINTLINNNETINIFFDDTGSPQVIFANASSTYHNDKLSISGNGITYTDYNSSWVSFNIYQDSVISIIDIVID